MGIMKYSRLGDTFFEDKAKKINQALEKINAPYYQVCKKVRGSKANKDAFDISWRKRNITCDTDYPNATTTGEKVVMRQLEKHFGISLSLLNSDTPRAIKKSLDYQKAQQTILDNKIKARQERERAAAERKALRNAPKTKTTTTKSIPPSERNDNKAVASKNNEVFTEVDGNITYFYTETKNNRRRNHAKLNIATNRITYLNSAVPMYVKEFIKGYKSVNILNKKMISKMQESKSSPAKSTKAVEEKKEIEETMRSVSDIVQKLFMDKGYFTKWNLINFVNPITGTIKDKNNIKEVGKIKIEVGNMNDIAIKTMRNDFSVFIETTETNNTFYGRKSDLKDKDWLSEFKEAINEFIRDNIDKKETNYDIKDIISNIEYQLDQTGYSYTIPFSASKNVTSTQAEFEINSYLTNEHFANLSLIIYDKSFKIIIRLKDKSPNSQIGDGGVKSYLVPMAEYEDSTQFEKPFKELKIELDKLSVARREQEEKKEEMLKKINLKVKKYSTKDIDLDEEEEEDAEFQMEYGIKEDEEDEKREKRKMGLPTQEEINEFVDSFNTAIQKVYFYTIIPALNLKDKVKVATTVTDYKYKYPYNTIFYNNSEKGNIYISIEEINNIMNPFYINLDFKFIDGSRYIGQKFVVSKDELDKFKKLNRFDKKFEYIQSRFDKELRSEMSRFLREIVKKEIDMLTPKREEPQYTKVKATDFARKMGIEVNEMKPMTEPETKFESKKLTSLNMLISAVENLIKVWTFKNRPEFFGKIIPNVVKKANNYPPLTTLSINFGDKIVIFDFSAVTKNKVDYYTIQLGNAEKLFFKRNGNMEDIGNDLLDYIELHLPDQLPADTYMTKVETSKWVKSTRGSGGEYNPETTEIIKETPPIMIDEDEAAKFDKGLDELTKLLQQAMQG